MGADMYLGSADRQLLGGHRELLRDRAGGNAMYQHPKDRVIPGPEAGADVPATVGGIAGR